MHLLSFVESMNFVYKQDVLRPSMLIKASASLITLFDFFYAGFTAENCIHRLSVWS